MMSPLNKSQLQKFRKDIIKSIENIIGRNTKTGIINLLNQILALNQEAPTFLRKYTQIIKQFEQIDTYTMKESQNKYKLIDCLQKGKQNNYLQIIIQILQSYMCVVDPSTDDKQKLIDDQEQQQQIPVIPEITDDSVSDLHYSYQPKRPLTDTLECLNVKQLYDDNTKDIVIDQSYNQQDQSNISLSSRRSSKQNKQSQTRKEPQKLQYKINQSTQATEKIDIPIDAQSISQQQQKLQHQQKIQRLLQQKQLLQQQQQTLELSDEMQKQSKLVQTAENNQLKQSDSTVERGSQTDQQNNILQTSQNSQIQYQELRQDSKSLQMLQKLMDTSVTEQTNQKQKLMKTQKQQLEDQQKRINDQYDQYKQQLEDQQLYIQQQLNQIKQQQYDYDEDRTSAIHIVNNTFDDQDDQQNLQYLDDSQQSQQQHLDQVQLNSQQANKQQTLKKQKYGKPKRYGTYKYDGDLSISQELSQISASLKGKLKQTSDEYSKIQLIALLQGRQEIAQILRQKLIEKIQIFEQKVQLRKSQILNQQAKECVAIEDMKKCLLVRLSQMNQECERLKVLYKTGRTKNYKKQQQLQDNQKLFTSLQVTNDINNIQISTLQQELKSQMNNLIQLKADFDRKSQLYQSLLQNTM